MNVAGMLDYMEGDALLERLVVEVKIFTLVKRPVNYLLKWLFLK